MAASISPTTPSSDFAQWDEPSPRSRSRPKSQRRDSQRARKASPQRIKPRPANPTVINSILDSLDTLTPPPIITGDERSSDSDSRSSRPRSAHSAIGSLPSLAPSTPQGFGVEYGSRLALDDDEGVTNAALPPTIRTSRPPSGLSQYNGDSRRLSSTNLSPAKATLTPSSRRSSRSSLNQTKGGVHSNKLSAASWVKQDSRSQETVETKRSSRSRESRVRRKSLRRINSQESLRSSRTEIKFVPPAPADEAAEPPPSISRAEQIIAKARTPPVASSKRRLFLTDEGSEEQVQHSMEAADDIRSASPPPDIRRGDEDEVLDESEGVNTPHRVSPLNNAIVDSIPMRTSSLRQNSKSPRPGKKKDRKVKRSSAKSAKIDSKTNSMEADNKETEAIPEDSWADLGEEDETVKRIRELRQQRKSRLMDSRAFSMPNGLPTAANTEANHEPLPPNVEGENGRPKLSSATENGEASKREGPIARPAPPRAATSGAVKPSSKALKFLGVADEEVSQSYGAHETIPIVQTTSGSPPDLTRDRKYSLDQSRAALRPSTALSSHSTVSPQLSLDYSYAQAVDVLQGTEGEIRRKEQQSPMKPSPLKTTYLDLVSPDTPLRDASPTVSRKPSTKRRQDRWTLHHPDLPLDAEKKRSRRKSTSDARLGREKDEANDGSQRRDSVDIAVLQYLQSERLSRKLRHPQTGRVISFSEVGDPNGATVFVCLGMGLTRYVTAFYDELATTLRLRLITVDRPGVGSSEPYPSSDRSGPLSWPDDVLAICQHLGIHSFSLLAHSAGAVYALASALILPHMIQGKVHLLAPWIPPSQLQAVSHSAATAPPVAALPRSQRFLRVLPTPFLKAANSSFMTATSASLKPATKRNKTHAAKLETIHQNTVADYPSNRPSPASDRPSTSDGHARAGAPDFTRRESMMLMDQFMPSINPMENFPIPLSQSNEEDSPLKRGSLVMSATATPMDPSFEYAYSALNAAEHEEKQRKSEFTSRLTQSTWELATKDSNPATDLLVCLERHRDVGFRYTDVTREVVITHGSEDKRVPVANVKWLAEQMNRRALGETSAEAAVSVESVARGKGGCEVRVLEGEGHGLMASPLIMGDVLTEIAGYWTAGKRVAVGM